MDEEIDWRARWEESRRKRYGVRFFPEPEWMKHPKPMICRWCGKRIPLVIDGKKSTQRFYHPECKREYYLHTQLREQFDFLIERDGERCAMVGCGATPVKWNPGPVFTMTADSIRKGFRANEPDMIEWAAQLWEAADKPWQERTEEEAQIGAQQSLCYRSRALEVDHRIPLWEVAHLPDDERRWYFGPGNLWLLCPPCHKAKTRREAARRAFEKRMAIAQLGLFDSFEEGAGINPS